MPESIDMTTQTASMRQIHAAIEHFEKQNFECAITLAAAGEGMLPSTDRPHFHQKLKELGARHGGIVDGATGSNDIITWLKHGTFEGKKLGSATILEIEVQAVIWRAISKFVAIYEKPTPQMESFASETASKLLEQKEKPPTG